MTALNAAAASGNTSVCLLPLKASHAPINFGFGAAHETLKGGVFGQALDGLARRAKKCEVAILLDSAALRP